MNEWMGVLTLGRAHWLKSQGTWIWQNVARTYSMAAWNNAKHHTSLCIQIFACVKNIGTAAGLHWTKLNCHVLDVNKSQVGLIALNITGLNLDCTYSELFKLKRQQILVGPVYCFANTKEWHTKEWIHQWSCSFCFTHIMKREGRVINTLSQ